MDLYKKDFFLKNIKQNTIFGFDIIYLSKKL